jgi:drug/metabolite transporter (DMT)-like permease
VEQKMSKNMIAKLLLVAGGLTWALTPLLVGLVNMTLLPTLWGRALFTALFLWLGIYLQIKLTKVNEKSSWRGWFKEIGIGIWSAASTGFFVSACVLTSPIRVYALFYAFPLYSILIDMIGGKTPTKRQKTTVFIGVIGVVIFAYSSWGEKPFGLGEFFAFCSSMVWMIYAKLAHKLTTDLQSLRATMKGQLIVATVFTLLLFFMGKSADFSIPNLSQFFWLSILGLTTAIPLFGWGWAARYVPVHVAGAITQIEAPLGVIAVYLFFGQSIEIWSAIGGAFILIAAFISLTPEKKS